MQLEFKTRNPKQIEAAEAWVDPVIEQILYGGAKGGAKSYTGCQLIFGSAHMYPKTHWFIARRQRIDLKRFTIPSILEVHEHWGFSEKWVERNLHFDGNLSIYTLPNKSKVFLIECADDPSDPFFERFGSMQMTGGWIEEAGEVPEFARDNLWLSIGRWKNLEYNIPPKLFITANPKKGWLKRDFVDPWKAKKPFPTMKFIPALSTDNPYLPDSYHTKLKNTRNNVMRQRLAFGNWDYEDDADSIVESEALEDAFTNTLEEERTEKYMVVDVARKGRDKTAISLWKGLEMYKVITYEKQSTDTTEEKIKELAAEHKIPFSRIIVDEDGIGGGVVDHLKGVKGFKAGMRPMLTKTEIIESRSKVVKKLGHAQKTTFAGLKSQCAWKLAELINEHKIAFKTPDLREIIVEELTALLRDKDPDNDFLRKLRPKKEVKVDLGGKSPDIGDTIIMRAYFELKREATSNIEEKTEEAQEEQLFIFARNRKARSFKSSR